MKIRKLISALFNSLKQIIFDNFIYKYVDVYPQVVNFPITGKCNMHCVMCNVWKKENQHKYEMSSDDIEKVFSQKLFKRVKHVGISGGEPFIRKDIDKIVEKIIENSKHIQSISIISNGTLTDKIIEKVFKINDICKNNGVRFSIAFSIDGMDEIHNKVRGNDNSFSNLLNTLEKLKATEVKDKMSLCCTITKENINDLYEVLQFAKKQGICIKFRIATEISRLHNSDLKDNYTFTREDKIKIAKFYDKLYYKYEKNWHQRFYYLGTKYNLLYNKKRVLGCDWRRKGISLDAEGNLYYCFVKSKAIGNLLNDDGWKKYKENDKERNNIIKNYCDTCIHDYIGNIDLSFKFKFVCEKVFSKISNKLKNLKIVYINIILNILINKRKKLKVNDNVKNIFITGWYGTETTGDKAILAGIYGEFVKFNPNVKFILSSIIPYYTEETVKELNLKNVSIVKRNSKKEIEYLRKSDLVVMGGGPLMDIRETIDIMWIFYKSIKFNIPTCVYCCGIGPLNNKHYKNVVKNIFQLSCYNFTRDENSLKVYNDVVKDIEVEANVDPAIAYLMNFREDNVVKNKRVLACIREWPQNYTKVEDKYEFDKMKDKYLNKLCEALIFLIKDGYTIDFFPMNTFYIGDDDRDYYVAVRDKLNDYKDSIHFYNKEYTTEETINIFKNHQIILGMRFHSVVFGNTLGIPTIGIDYDTNKGKIYGFMNEINMERNYVSINDIINNKENIIVDKLKNLDQEKAIKDLEKIYYYYCNTVDIPLKKILNRKG